MALGRRRKTASEMASGGSDLSGDQEPDLEGIAVGQEPRSVDRLLHTVSKQRKSKCLQSQAEARQVWSREAKSLWSQQDSICPAARQLLAGDTYLAVKAEHFRQAELFCLVEYRDFFDHKCYHIYHVTPLCAQISASKFQNLSRIPLKKLTQNFKTHSKF